MIISRTARTLARLTLYDAMKDHPVTAIGSKNVARAINSMKRNAIPEDNASDPRPGNSVPTRYLWRFVPYVPSAPEIVPSSSYQPPGPWRSQSIADDRP